MPSFVQCRIISLWYEGIFISRRTNLEISDALVSHFLLLCSPLGACAISGVEGELGMKAWNVCLEFLLAWGLEIMRMTGLGVRDMWTGKINKTTGRELR